MGNAESGTQQLIRCRVKMQQLLLIKFKNDYLNPGIIINLTKYERVCVAISLKCLQLFSDS